MKCLTFINQFDPCGDRVGGIGNYIKNFIKFGPDDYTYKIIGVSQELQVGKWTDIQLCGRKVGFLSIVKIGSHNKRTRIPLSLLFSFNLYRFRKLIDENSHLLCQRNEYAIALKNTQNQIYLFIHNDLALHLKGAMSENLWSKMPFVYDYIQALAYKRTEHVFSVNHKSIDYVCNRIDSFRDKITFINTWADPDRFSTIPKSEREELGCRLAQEHNIDPYKKRLIFLGRFQKQKNIQLLLNSFLRVKERCVLFMAGVGEEGVFIEQFIKDNSLEKDIVLLGNVPHDKVPNLLNSCDIYVSSSNFEGMSIALMEALACGLYAVTTDTGEARHILDKDKNGIIARDFSTDSFADAINEAIDILDCDTFTFDFDSDKFSPYRSIEIVLQKLS